MRRVLDHRNHLHELARIAEENRLRNRYLRDINAPPNIPRRQRQPQRRNLIEVLQNIMEALSERLISDEMTAT
jgi:hypothetical protein